MILFLLYLVFAVWSIGRGKFSKIFFQFLILPILFSIASFVFVLFLVNAYAFHFFVVISGLIIYFLLNQYFIYVNFPYKYQPYSLESLSFYIDLILFYFVLSASFAARLLLKINPFLLIAIIVPIFALALYNFFWIHKVNFKKSWLYILIIILTLVELWIAVVYLPTSYYVDAFVLIVASYVMLGISRGFIQKNLSRKRVISYLSVASLLILIILLTAKWS